MELIVAVFLTLVVISWISKPTQQTKRTPRKPKYKQYDEDRYADYFMKKVSEVYNIKERPEEQSEEDDEEETENDIELEKKSELPPIWSSQQTQYNSYEIEDMEIRSKFFESISKVLELIGILCLFGIIVIKTNFPNVESFLASKTLISLLVKTIPVLLLIFSAVTRILGSRNKSSENRVLTIVRGISLLLLGLGYVVNQLSDFLSNSK